MREDRDWFWGSKIRNRDNKSSLYWVLRCLVLPILVRITKA